MHAGPAKLLALGFRPVNWLYTVLADQTQINWVLPQTTKCSAPALLVHDNGKGDGLLLFGITTHSKHPVEITRIEIDYAAPIQILDPGEVRFFKTSGTQDWDFPFRLYWEGSALIRRNLQQAFGATIRFRNEVKARPIRIRVHAMRQWTRLGGFPEKGRSQMTSRRFLVTLTSENIIGLCVPPKSAMVSPQPFLNASSVTAVGKGPALVHEIFNDGRTSSKQVILPGDVSDES